MTSLEVFKSIVLAATLGLTAAAPVLAQAPRADAAADAVLGAASPDRPAISALVANADGVIYEQAIGSAELDHRIPNTLDTRFLIGSVSKQFTAFAAIRLAQEGGIDLRADIRTYLPEMPDYGVPITVSDLIHHTSGLRDQVELMILEGTPIEGLVEQRVALSTIFRQKGLNFRPGTEFRYCNSNYTLLAEIVRRRSGMSFRDYLRTRIFEPLGMTDSYLSDVATEIVPRRATGYSREKDGTFRRALLNYGIYGSTGVWTTPRDLLKWSRELMRPKVFDKALVADFIRPGALRDGTPSTYGNALITAPFAGRPAFYHAGADPGFQAILVNYPALDTSIIVMSAGDEDASQVASRLAGLFLPKLPASPAPNAVSPDESRLRSLAGFYTDDWGPGISFSVENGKLVLAAGDAKVPVTWASRDSFYIGSPSATISIAPNGDLLSRSALSGTFSAFRRQTLVKPASTELAALEGSYRSEEIDTTFDLHAADGHLIMRSLRNEPVTLYPAQRDVFETREQRYPAIRLQVTRDAAGAATGFELATGRMRGLAFARLKDAARR